MIQSTVHYGQKHAPYLEPERALLNTRSAHLGHARAHGAYPQNSTFSLHRTNSTSRTDRIDLQGSV